MRHFNCGLGLGPQEGRSFSPDFSVKNMYQCTFMYLSPN